MGGGVENLPTVKVAPVTWSPSTARSRARVTGAGRIVHIHSGRAASQSSFSSSTDGEKPPRTTRQPFALATL